MRCNEKIEMYQMVICKSNKKLYLTLKIVKYEKL